MGKKLLAVENFSVSFNQYVKGTEMREINVIKNLSMDINEKEIVAIVGASGSGKSLLAHSILGILPSNSICEGKISYKGEELTELRKRELRGKEITFIPQSVNYLDPLMKVGKQVQIGLDKKNAAIKQRELFSRYGLKESDGKLFPYQLSGGMLRRVLFATSVREGVKLVIADEPTPGLHPEALDEILKQIADFKDQGASVMLITHDIISALKIANRVVVLNNGETIEIADAKDFVGKGERLKNPYTRKLWNALPQNDFIFQEREKQTV
ncbi:MAG: ATP-binding cassette domain-containing protein [Clostridium sp.]